MEKEDWKIMMEKMQDVRLFSSMNVQRVSKKEKLSSQEFYLLSKIFISEELLTPRMLSDQVGISRPLLSKLIENLMEEKFLRKKEIAADRRSYCVEVTEKGKRQLEELYKQYLKPIYDLRRGLGEEEFLELTAKIRDANQKMQKYLTD